MSSQAAKSAKPRRRARRGRSSNDAERALEEAGPPAGGGEGGRQALDLERPLRLDERELHEGQPAAQHGEERLGGVRNDGAGAGHLEAARGQRHQVGGLRRGVGLGEGGRVAAHRLEHDDDHAGARPGAQRGEPGVVHQRGWVVALEPDLGRAGVAVVGEPAPVGAQDRVAAQALEGERAAVGREERDHEGEGGDGARRRARARRPRRTGGAGGRAGAGRGGRRRGCRGGAARRASEPQPSWAACSETMPETSPKRSSPTAITCQLSCSPAIPR